MPTLTLPTLRNLVGGGTDADRAAAGPAGDGPDGTDPRFRARRAAVRADRSARRRRWARRALVVLTVVAVIYGGVRSPLLDIDDVHVTGADRTGADVAAAAGTLLVGGALVDVRPTDATARIEALPWVDSASVERSWWGRIDVSVRERRPVAEVVDGGRRLLVDATGRVLAVVTASDPALLTIEGSEVAEPGGTLGPRYASAVEIGAALPPGVRSRIAVVGVGDDGAITMTLRPKGTVTWGRADQLDTKLRSLTTILGQVDLAGICDIDVRVPAMTAVTRDC